MSELPKSWKKITLKEECSSVKGKKPKSLMGEQSGSVVPYVDIKAFEKGIFTKFAEPNSGVLALEEDTLMVWDGARSGLVGNGVEGVIGSTLVKINPTYSNVRYLHYFLKSQFKFINSNTKGTGIPHVDPAVLWTIPFPLAPLNEQIRIADKLDSILAKVDKAQARLDKIPAILKRFRQSVLAAATSGELTKEWRGVASGLNEALADYADKIENGRFDSWVQSKLREFEKKGKLPQSDKWKEKYSCKRGNLEPEGRVEEWNYESLDYLADVIDPNPKHRNPKYFEEGYHFISTAQFDGYDDFDLSNCKFVALDTIEEQKERCNFSSRSIAVSRKGTIGETRILDLDFPFALLDSVCVVNIDRAISHRYLNYALRGEWVQKQIYSKTKGVALKQVSVGAVRELVIPIPVYSEQCEIVNKLDYMLSKATKVEKQYLEAKARLDRLTQSILVKAFRGELVPQDPNDEPAEKLLERILAEKEQNQPKKATRKRATKAKTAEKE